MKTVFRSAAAIALVFSSVGLSSHSYAQITEDAAAELPGLEMRAEQVLKVIDGALPDAYDEVFTDAFLADVPPDQLSALSGQLVAQYGEAQAVESIRAASASQAEVRFRMERAIVVAQLTLDRSDGNRILGLLLTGSEPVDDNLAKIEADLASLPGTVRAYFSPLGEGVPSIDMGSDEPMPLGSTFKLYVLAALAQDIAEGTRRWSDVVTLDTASFPSGQMQDWPQGSPVTLHTLASMMISISDNTATDQLIEIVGRERILDVMAQSGHSDPSLNTPFLNTRELFELKGGSTDRLEAYRDGDDMDKGAILATVDGSVTAAQIEAAFATGPVALDIEWFATPRDLANLFAHMKRSADEAAFPIMAINKNATAIVAENWAYIGYKGGSEPGVLNLTWLLQDKAGDWHILTLGWSNPDAALDEDRLGQIGQRILALPR